MKNLKVAINGFGRIGRSVFRILEGVDGIDVVAINDLFDHGALRYLLNYDTVMGRFDGSLALEDDYIVTDKSRVRMLSESQPSALPWGELGVDAVIESTGAFRTRAKLQQHIDAGAERVVLTVPAKDEIDLMVVLGVNDEQLDPRTASFQMPAVRQTAWRPWSVCSTTASVSSRAS